MRGCHERHHIVQRRKRQRRLCRRRRRRRKRCDGLEKAPLSSEPLPPSLLPPNLAQQRSTSSTGSLDSSKAGSFAELRGGGAGAENGSILGGGPESSPGSATAFADATSMLSGDFGLWYLGIEVALAVLVSAVMNWIKATEGSDEHAYGVAVTVTYALFFLLAIVAVLFQHTSVLSEWRLKEI